MYVVVSVSHITLSHHSQFSNTATLGTRQSAWHTIESTMRTIQGIDPNYAVLNKIGEGAFGVVTRIQRVQDGKVNAPLASLGLPVHMWSCMLTDGKIMACKQIRCRRSNLVNVQRELDICVRLSREPYIAQFSGDVAWNQATSDLLLYMEYYPGGDLHEVIKFCNLHSTTVDPILATR
jgi:serine/threonine protein kinase